MKRTLLIAVITSIIFLTASCGTRNPREFNLRVRTTAIGFSTREDLSQVYAKSCVDAILNGTRFNVNPDGVAVLKTSSTPLAIPASPILTINFDTEKLPNGMYITRTPVSFAASIMAARVYPIEGSYTVRHGDNSGFISQIYLDELRSIHARRPALNTGWIFMTEVDYKLQSDGNIKVHYRGLIAEGGVE